MTSWKSTDDVLHIIAQEEWHDDARIIGTVEGLIRLRNAIQAALDAPNETQKATVMTNDGEGFFALVRCVSADYADDIPCGYTADCAKDKRECPEWFND
ncbi:hypothetical protein [Acetobacter pasteurianus]|uniref:Uncharacterized protein n=1 Tax=Acetobacter pasteurianus subsp. pasteurianus TaxID=481145 RepID=A0A1Y0XYT5_ACEPA|nr:hypothetical protein [Acetobacter pasteurianus]ARW48099.1 hypothetical protein S1001342_01776 [Acetobacter pasteurianus subsp. pasteurianus]